MLAALTATWIAHYGSPIRIKYDEGEDQVFDIGKCKLKV